MFVFACIKQVPNDPIYDYITDLSYCDSCPVDICFECAEMDIEDNGIPEDSTDE